MANLIILDCILLSYVVEKSLQWKFHLSQKKESIIVSREEFLRLHSMERFNRFLYVISKLNQNYKQETSFSANKFVIKRRNDCE